MKGKIIFSFVAGLVIGGATAGIVTKHICDSRKEEELESCRATIKNLVHEVNEYKKKEGGANDTEDPANIKKRNDEVIESVLEGVKAIQKEHKYVNYSDVNDSSNKEASPLEKEEVKKRVDIEKITEAIFNEPNSKFEKCGITLYMDAVFTDDDDKEMDDGYLSETIGVEIKEELLDSEVIGTVYVRNYKNNCDYEILCLDESWSDAHNVE